ncbi:FAD-dependent oxidoreductase [Schlegelella sp. S2-27]|uniref:FAD-dependent oxidoreductase n=1 Tax=Caldimonas mangrovi TaxID=2944811 RepID=A0ABT0YPG9_9BURK|nr:FAD-dependent oxidoreductase [Caldimonas mangrovi]MCM5680631.1 FAD-dependent oxidoreductase [Caldimonas mangrovi]
MVRLRANFGAESISQRIPGASHLATSVRQQRITRCVSNATCIDRRCRRLVRRFGMIEDVIVVGGGPAGAACALWTHQLGLRVLLLEAGSAVGGLQLRSPYGNPWIPGVQGKTGQQVAASLQAHLEAAAVPHALNFAAAEIKRSVEHVGWEVSNERATHAARYVVIATGAKPRREGFVESDRVGIGPGISMERLDVAGKRVAILGGGDNAFDQAASAKRRGARCVDIYCRRAPRAQPLLVRQVEARCVHIGPFHADPLSMSVNGAPYDIFGVQFGFQACIPGGLQLPLIDGYIDVDRRGAVRRFPRLFAAGEVTNYWHPCVTTSYAHGVQVAKSIQNELQLAHSVAPASPVSLLAHVS